MKLDTLETFVVGNPPPRHGGRYFIFVRLTTACGITGIGEIYNATFGPDICCAMARDMFARHFDGADPHHIETLFRKSYGAGFSQRPDISVMGVFSGLEMACWDIVGKAADKPVYELLGGRVNDRLRSYSYIYPPAGDVYPDPDTPNAYNTASIAAEVAAGMVQQGFTAVKFDPAGPFSIFDGRQPSLDDIALSVDFCRQIREAVGTKADLLFGTHGQFTVSGAKRMARALEPYDPLWFEEPLPPENPADMAQVAAFTSIPVATGERLCTKHEFARVLEASAASILQINLGRVGGLLEAKKIASMAETRSAQIAPHLYCGPVVAAANIQIATCSPNFLVLESIGTFDGPYMTAVKGEITWEDGYIIPPTAPGLGLELDDAAIAQLPYEGKELHLEMAQTPTYPKETHTMLTLDKFYIDGAWVKPASDAVMPIMNPATASQIGTVSMGNEQDVDRAVAAAKRAFETFSLTTKQERLALLESLAVQTKARLGDLAQAMTAEMGAPATMSLEVQAQSGLGHLEDFISALKSMEDEETLPNGDIISREAIGVCGLITPWNWPINQIAQKVVPALAVGATCVLKPSEHTPLSAQIYAEIVHAAGYPAGVFNLVQGDGPSVGSAMSRHPDIDMMSFTGSTRAGTLVSKDAADSVKRVTLELGGKSPNLVFADADLETRVAGGVAECFDNSGQSCNAPTRMLVERSCYAQVLELAKAAAEAQAVGDPTQPGDHIGPVFDKIQYDRVQSMIKVGIDEGARLLVGGLGKPEGLEGGWYVKPTIFCDVSPDMQISREEIFGPVLVITPFDGEEEGIAMANDTDYGLAAYVQSGDEARVSRVVRRLRAGTIQINGRGPDYGSPFGGYKQSGNGREGGIFGLEDYLEIKVRPPFAA